MSKDNTQLPDHAVEEIKIKAEDYANRHANIRTQPEIWEIIYTVAASIATEYATKLHQAEQENKEWKEECERLAKVAEYWQQEYYKLNPPHQPIKIDNNPIA